MTSRIPYKGPYVVKSQLVEQNDPFLINKIACTVDGTSSGSPNLSVIVQLFLGSFHTVVTHRLGRCFAETDAHFFLII